MALIRSTVRCLSAAVQHAASAHYACARVFNSSAAALQATPRVCHVFDYAGLTPYAQAWKWQQDLLQARVATEPPERAGEPLVRARPHRDVLLMLQHPHVYTMGRGAVVEDLRFAPGDGIVDAEVHRVERGGKITYHGPGQLVVYPILDLTHHRKDLHWYVTSIEQVIIDSLAVYGVVAHRYVGYPGVWVGEEKIAQVGMNCSKWFTMHGFAINVSPDMSYFDHIVPCGIKDKAVTSLSRLIHKDVPMPEFTQVVRSAFAWCFKVELVNGTGEPTEGD